MCLQLDWYFGVDVDNTLTLIYSLLQTFTFALFLPILTQCFHNFVQLTFSRCFLVNRRFIIVTVLGTP